MPDPDFEVLPIPDPGVNKAPDPGSGSATMVLRAFVRLSWNRIWIRIGNADPHPDPVAWKLTEIYK
jgi:hypothetical protein